MIKLLLILKTIEDWFNIKIIENNRAVEAKAWVIKYLREASEANRFLFLFIRGIIDRRLISRPIHIPTHDEEEIEIMDPVIKDKKNEIL